MLQFALRLGHLSCVVRESDRSLRQAGTRRVDQEALKWNTGCNTGSSLSTMPVAVQHCAKPFRQHDGTTFRADASLPDWVSATLHNSHCHILLHSSQISLSSMKLTSIKTPSTVKLQENATKKCSSMAEDHLLGLHCHLWQGR